MQNIVVSAPTGGKFDDTIVDSSTPYFTTIRAAQFTDGSLLTKTMKIKLRLFHQNIAKGSSLFALPHVSVVGR